MRTGSDDSCPLGLSGVGILARQPSFQRGLLGLVHRRDRDIDRCRRVTFGVVGAALQLAGFPLGLPLDDFVARDRLPLLRPVLYVSLRSLHLCTLLLDAPM